MKRLISIFVCLVFSLSAIPKSNAADLVVLTKNGATISFVSPIYTVTGTSTIYADYSNQTGYGILIFGYELTDKFGTSLADGSSISVPNGTSGRMSAYWSEYSISRGVAPFTLTLKVVYNAVHNKPDDYHSIPFTFVSRTAITPTPTPSATTKPTPTPSVTATPSPAATVKTLEVPDLSPTTTLRWQDTMLYARVQVPAGIKNGQIPIEGIKARLFFGTVPISSKDSIQPITINAAYEVNFTWELSSVWKSLMLAEWPMRVETEFYNSAGSGVKQNSEIAVPRVSVTPSPTTVAKEIIKKTTITCIKGKLVKKVTALKPKCPTGYKKK
jgi:hypothetical protein